ncbi:GldB [Fulvivirga imtechensis AK7]|uniref:GldB n=1 Tax=Fulvivirga imtechensis AK7 TaxID=1237149 RepID=L8JM49_9BACT|nr:gliding motility lipoprotein GldB [Fulvivirga imtechensis]ELR69283.1 GldB [Fulvivirga imtechensis AK7]
MIKGLRVLLLIMSAAFLFTACNDETKECAYQPDISAVKIELEVEQLEDQLLSVKTKSELRSFLQAHPVITQFFLKQSQYPDDSIMMEVLFKRFQNPHIDTLRHEIDRVFGDLSALKADLNTAFTHLKYYYPDVELPKVQTIATGLDNDLYVSDSLIVIGLDYYLGDHAKFRPLGLYQYMLDRYRPEYIVPSIMLLYGISGQYNKTDVSDKTMLADMIGYGKSFYFAKRMLPCAPDSVLIWYSPEELKGVRENRDIVWAHFIENQLLYETNHMVKKKYIDERPKTFEIGEKAPGRIGTWLGWEIVNQYMQKHKEVTLPELMNISDAKKIFNEANYKPKRP